LTTSAAPSNGATRATRATAHSIYELVGVAADGTHRVLLDGDDGLQGAAVVVREDAAFSSNGALREGDRLALRVARLVGG
jgi:hypothetical protein